MTERKALMCGSFDPPTCGHMSMLAQAAYKFDHVYISVGQNPIKMPRYPISLREELWDAALETMKLPNVSLCRPRQAKGKQIHPETIDLLFELGCSSVIRGIRDEVDLACEQEYKEDLLFAAKERDILVAVEWFYNLPNQLSVSSTKVCELIAANKFNCIEPFVDRSVYLLLEKFHSKTPSND